ncbi:ABC transporter permease [Rheinheimera salexigens]|uniref:Peptide ABC transporter permease n=1 Tax=Rheinheimera salexigens TaxID=1628148 RepID=A0A1E7Q970_9GAMM|nr:FtsX-like permease family protein [Rheinheimera salexigens]OEY70697.1 peptide ABC transporter permease [Rheinheimera salexigens]
MLIKLARLSLYNRRSTVLMTWLSLTISLALLLGIDHLRHEAKASFTNTVSGTDLIVGARSGQINLLLYSVFRIGNATANMNWSTYQKIIAHPQVKWSIPISLGDSHRGFRVMGTTTDYFKYFSYGNKQPLKLAQGEAFAGVFETVIGAEVANKLGYRLGQQIELSHGIGAVSFSQHKGKPFTIVGILNATGTPVDQTVHVNLPAIEAIHQGWQQGAPALARPNAADNLDKLQPSSITAFMLGLNSPMATFTLQREINTYRAEPLSAILPGVALAELWQMLAMVENMLLLISMMVLLAALVGMVTTLLASMQQRQRELAILRAAGANAWYVFALIQIEVLLLMLAAFISAAGLLALILSLLASSLAANYSLMISWHIIHSHTGYWALAILIFAAVLALLPSIQAYRNTLNDGLSVKL